MEIARWLLDRPACIFLVWASWLAFPCLLAGPGSYLRIYDNADGVISSRMAAASEVLSGNFALWCRFANCGVDRFAANQAAQADLFLFLIFPPWLAYGVMILVQRFLAGYFTHRLLVDRLGV